MVSPELKRVFADTLNNQGPQAAQRVLEQLRGSIPESAYNAGLGMIGEATRYGAKAQMMKDGGKVKMVRPVYRQVGGLIPDEVGFGQPAQPQPMPPSQPMPAVTVQAGSPEANPAFQTGAPIPQPQAQAPIPGASQSRIAQRVAEYKKMFDAASPAITAGMPSPSIDGQGDGPVFIENGAGSVVNGQVGQDQGIDTVDAALEPGAMVMNQEAVELFGDKIKGYAKGGWVK